MDQDLPHLLAEERGASAPTAPAPDRPQSEFGEAVLRGFGQTPRSIPCRFFYDARGARLFEEITTLPEYYPTRVETALLEDYGAEIAEAMGEAHLLVEFGSGSSRKTSLLLDALISVDLYIPIDVAEESLAEAAEWLSGRHRGLTIVPLIADFTATRALPQVAQGKKRLGFFSGSTIGNLTHDEARAFLSNAARLLAGTSASTQMTGTPDSMAALIGPTSAEGSQPTTMMPAGLRAAVCSTAATRPGMSMLLGPAIVTRTPSSSPPRRSAG